ncbi:hypothetical protein GCM10022226_19720 [Sphaerisporangium flaviroseum]|uniref:Uncharacterized protein n=1 Tax=Sphaerisporangium flaviroseum TaxID=509199 RepID=A0ABP7HSB0_9ACTN
MRKTIRTCWIATGGMLTTLAVGGMALGAWATIDLPRDYDFTFPGSYDSADLGRQTIETSTVTYAITTPLVIVDATGRVEVRAAPGVAGRLTVRRELTWHDGDREFSETWQDGRTLRVSLACRGPDLPAEPWCKARYTLAVPPGVKLMLATPRGLAPCPLTTSEAGCDPPTPRPVG